MFARQASPRAGAPLAAGGDFASGRLAARLDGLARRAEASDPSGPAAAIFICVLALFALGFLVQVSHAATTVPHQAFGAEVLRLARFRLLGLAVLLIAFRIGPRGLERVLPLLLGLALCALCYVLGPWVDPINGSRRWIELPWIAVSLQPSEFARVLAVVWVARRCAQLGTRLERARAGYLPMFAFCLALFVLILVEPDLGGALLFFICVLSTMWVGGARPVHLAGSLALILALGLSVGLTRYHHVRERIEVWLGNSQNDQVSRAAEAMASGDLLGVGLTHGGFRNQNLQYMQTDYVFSLVGEELGFLGLAVVLGIFATFGYFSLRLVSSLRDRYCALAAFGLLVSVAFQALVHVQVVTGLAPPKGITLPFLSEGGSSLIASSLAVGLALGAARHAPKDRGSPAFP